MPNQPPYAQGPNLTTLNLTGVNYNALGVPTLGTTYSIQAYVRRLRHGVRKTFEDWRPLTSLQIHNLLTGYGSEMELAEIVRTDSAPVLSTLENAYTHVIVTYVKATETFNPAYFRIGDFDGPVEGPGGMEVTLQLVPYNPGTAQVTRTV